MCIRDRPMYLKNVLTLRVCSSLLTDSLANLSLPRSTLPRPWTPARAPGVPHKLCRWRALASSGELGTVFSREGTRPSVARPRLRGEAPARPRGPGGCTETARDVHRVHRHQGPHALPVGCLLYTSDAADDLTRVDLGGRRII